MALLQFVCCFTGMVILLCKGCHSQQPACGTVVKNSRIMGGQNASPGSWPWQATLFINNRLCGGSLITNQWVLTAASCITPSDRLNTVVLLGLQNMLNLKKTLEDVICHPNFNSLTHENDICLLKLSAPVNFTDYIQPICLASENSTFYNGTSSWVTGFGGGLLPSFLQEVNVPIVGANQCKCYYTNLTKITENMICSGLGAEGKSPCYGDLGGPLISKTDSIWVQSGVATVGDAGCDNPVRPGVYTRVSKYQKWITDTVTGTPPGFVIVTSPGTDSDLEVTCSKSATNTPTVTTTVALTTVTTTTGNTTHATTDHATVHSGENLIHVTHFTSLCAFVFLLHIFIGNGM